MITLTARIQLFGDGSNSVKSVTSTNPPNNISNSINNIKNRRVRSGNAFILGSSKIGDSSTFSNGVDYYIGELLSDENGQFASGSGFAFNIEPLTKLHDITIVFDDIGNGYPTELKVSTGDRIYNDDPIVTLKVEALNNYITVYSWNKPKSPLIVRGVYTDVSIDLNYNNIISMSGAIFERSDYKLPSFGIISNSGNIEFNDLDGEILDYAEEGWLTGGLETKLKLTNTLVKNAQNDVGTYYTATWNYDTDNRTVSVSIKDDLEEWQDINVEGFIYSPKKPNNVLKNQTMADLYKWLWDRTPSKYKMQQFNELDDLTRIILNTTYIKYPLLKSGNLWQQWSKFCEANQTHIYKNFNGITVCKYNGGN